MQVLLPGHPVDEGADGELVPGQGKVAGLEAKHGAEVVDAVAGETGERKTEIRDLCAGNYPRDLLRLSLRLLLLGLRPVDVFLQRLTLAQVGRAQVAERVKLVGVDHQLALGVELGGVRVHAVE